MKLLIAFIVLTSSLFANTCEHKVPPSKINSAVGYFDIGLGPFPVPLPVFAFGYKRQLGHHGFDVSLSTSTVVFATQVKVTSLYAYHFKPNLNSQLYLGIGLGGSTLFQGKNTAFALSPEFVIGKQYRNEVGSTRFIKAKISFPTVGLSGKSKNRGYRKDVLWFPLVVFTYGFGF